MKEKMNKKDALKLKKGDKVKAPFYYKEGEVVEVILEPSEKYSVGKFPLILTNFDKDPLTYTFLQKN
ncbi:hypothetical protein H8D91_01930 [archaeon]|nr:hypothetical protein [archaeon]